MTTNEQAEALTKLLSEAILRARLGVFTPMANDAARRETAVWAEYVAEQLQPWLAGERHRVAEQCAQIAKRIGWERKSPDRFGTYQPNPVAGEIFVAIRAMFPAVGGSTPAVDEEGGDEWCRDESCHLTEGWASGSKMPTHKRTPQCPVPDSLPLDPEPWVNAAGERFAYDWTPDARSPRSFDPRPGFSRDESRYREGAGS